MYNKSSRSNYNNNIDEPGPVPVIERLTTILATIMRDFSYASLYTGVPVPVYTRAPLTLRLTDLSQRGSLICTTCTATIFGLWFGPKLTVHSPNNESLIFFGDFFLSWGLKGFFPIDLYKFSMEGKQVNLCAAWN